MDLSEFVTLDELDDLPDDPEAAFLQFVSLAQRRLQEKQRALDLNDNNDWEALNEARYSFINLILAAGKRFEIEPFISMAVPALKTFDTSEYKQIKADIDHCVTQLAIDQAFRRKRDSVKLAPPVKDRIRAHVLALKKEVEKANISDTKRSALLDKLNKFEAELEKRRLTLSELSHVLIALAVVPGGVWVSAEAAQKLIQNVVQAVGEAKATEDEQRKSIAYEPMKALSPPRSKNGRPTHSSIDTQDDDIPF